MSESAEHLGREETVAAGALDARTAAELREQLAALLGHDLRNPLSAVTACSQLLERKAQDPDIAKLASRVTANAVRMSRLISDILDFARSRLGGEMDLDLEEASGLEASLAAAVDEIGAAHPGRVVVRRIRLDGVVHCDPARVRQLVAILLANALVESVEGTVDVDVDIAGGELRIAVKDDGEPIPAGSLGDVFRPFWRRTALGRREDRGLGLFICQQIAEAHGGRIAVTSSREDGTRFVAHLPIGAGA